VLLSPGTTPAVDELPAVPPFPVAEPPGEDAEFVHDATVIPSKTTIAIREPAATLQWMARIGEGVRMASILPDDASDMTPRTT
jgi:hypothetical protein